MRALLSCFLFLCVGIALGVAVGIFLIGNASWKAPIIAEFKVHHHNLQSENLEPQLREYLKSRIYSLATLLESRDLQGYQFDFGPPDTKILAGVSGIKGAETEIEIYQLAQRKHRKDTAK
ncbi:MAG TPA: hypothetical protein VFG14_12125 [Chthoniobacteraceae bacterium]|nr:hypothetical protein [Chthoniobacteraceae bacterium]